MAETRFDMIRDMEKWRERLNGKPMNRERIHTDAVRYADSMIENDKGDGNGQA